MKGAPHVPMINMKTMLGALLVAVISVGFYYRTISFPFLVYDDDYYVTENPKVLEGISP
jgi:hypothetical protein